MAQADSSGIEYRDAPPTATGNEIPSSGPPATASKKNEAKPQVGSTNPDATGKESTEEDAGAGGGTGNGDGGTQGGNPGKAQGSPDKGSGTSKVSPAQPLASSDTGDDGGSSPLVPILIALALVIAAAIGVVVFRQRRQRRGTDARVSPEAS